MGILIILGLVTSVLCQNQELPTLTTIASEGGTLCTTLTVKEKRVVTSKVSFNTRVYNDGVPGPTIRLKAGDTVRVDLVNDLQPICDDSFDANTHPDFPPLLNTPTPATCAAHCSTCNNEQCCPTLTNLHTHGLHIDGIGIGDNVLRKCYAGWTCPYEYTIPSDHLGGTFWYHAHMHGSTAQHAQGGMAGALIIEDADNNLGSLGDMEETVIVMNYMVMGTNGQGSSTYQQVAAESLDPMDANIEWHDTQENFYLINGEWLPEVRDFQPGEYQRVRIVHASVTHYCDLGFASASTGCTMHLLARDGVYLSSPSVRDVLVLSPGSRVDVAIMCPTAGTYVMSCDNDHGSASAARDSVLTTNARVDGVNVMSLVVAGNSVTMAAPTTLPTWPDYLADLQSASVCAVGGDCHFSVNVGQGGGINGVLFEHDKVSHNKETRVDEITDTSIYLHQMQVNTVQEWEVSASRANHPLHIHVNHFQLISCDGGCVDDVAAVGEWRDTIPTMNNKAMVIRFLTDDHPGVVILHCHFVQHEDEGMMAVVEVLTANGGHASGDFNTQMTCPSGPPAPSPSPSPVPPSPSPSPIPAPSPSPSNADCVPFESSRTGRCNSFHPGTDLNANTAAECYAACLAVGSPRCCSFKARPTRCRYSPAATSVDTGRSAWIMWACGDFPTSPSPSPVPSPSPSPSPSISTCLPSSSSPGRCANAYHHSSGTEQQCRDSCIAAGVSCCSYRSRTGFCRHSTSNTVETWRGNWQTWNCPSQSPPSPSPSPSTLPVTCGTSSNPTVGRCNPNGWVASFSANTAEECFNLCSADATRGHCCSWKQNQRLCRRSWASAAHAGRSAWVSWFCMEPSPASSSRHLLSLQSDADATIVATNRAPVLLFAIGGTFVVATVMGVTVGLRRGRPVGDVGDEGADLA